MQHNAVSFHSAFFFTPQLSSCRVHLSKGLKTPKTEPKVHRRSFIHFTISKWKQLGVQSQRQNILQKHAFLRGMHLARKGLGNMWCDMFQPNSTKSPVTKSLVTTLFCKSQISFPNFSHMIFRTDHPLFFLKHFPHAHIKALPQSNSVSFYDMQMSLWPCPHMRHTKHVEFAVILRF